jgi:beta-glucanase (GH16 family)
MKKIAALSLSLLVIILTSGCASKWELVWSDEFNYKGLPDKNKWSYEEGFVRNKEMQYYTKARQENARVKNGLLIIEARKESIPNPDYQANSRNWKNERKTAEYTSASLTTLGKASFKYGRIEIRAKPPKAKGTWAAIWTLGTNRHLVSWPECGEIDIMEFIARRPRYIFSGENYATKNNKQSNNNAIRLKRSPSTGFHTYAIEWYPNRIDFFFDNQKYRTFWTNKANSKTGNPFRKLHYLLINLALGGWGGKIDDSALPQKFYIDYIRIYKKKRQQQ